jgi:hypothetical protein
VSGYHTYQVEPLVFALIISVSASADFDGAGSDGIEDFHGADDGALGLKFEVKASAGSGCEIGDVFLF